MTEALSENLIALLRAFTGISNLAITRPVRMPASNKRLIDSSNIRSTPVTITPEMLCTRVKKMMIGQLVLM